MASVTVKFNGIWRLYVGAGTATLQAGVIDEALDQIEKDFAPKFDEAFKATQAPAGTREKLEVLADRVRRGQPLWHDDDRADYSGLTGAIRPRD